MHWFVVVKITILNNTSIQPGFVNYKKGCTRLAAASDKAYQLLAYGRWFSPGTPASSTTKTGCHDIAEILLKLALNTIKSIKNQCIQIKKYYSLEQYIAIKNNNLKDFEKYWPPVKHVFLDFL